MYPTVNKLTDTDFDAARKAAYLRTAENEKIRMGLNLDDALQDLRQHLITLLRAMYCGKEPVSSMLGQGCVVVSKGVVDVPLSAENLYFRDRKGFNHVDLYPLIRHKSATATSTLEQLISDCPVLSGYGEVICTEVQDGRRKRHTYSIRLTYIA